MALDPLCFLEASPSNLAQAEFPPYSRLSILFSDIAAEGTPPFMKGYTAFSSLPLMEDLSYSGSRIMSGGTFIE